MKWMIVLSFLVLFACDGLGGEGAIDSNEFKVPDSNTMVTSDQMHITWTGFRGWGTLIDESDLIIQGIPQHTYFPEKDIFNQPADRTTSSYTEVEITESFEGNFDSGDRILVSEPYIVQGDIIFPQGNYVPLEHGEEYILFLKDRLYDAEYVAEQNPEAEVNEELLQLIEESYDLTMMGYSIYHEEKEVVAGRNYWEIEGLDELSDYYQYIFISEFEETEYPEIRTRVFEEFVNE